MHGSEIEQKNEELTSLLVEVVKNQKKNYKSLATIFIVVVVCLTVVICTLIGSFVWYESQFETQYMTTDVIEQQVDGDGNSINNIGGNQYNGNAVHNDSRVSNHSEGR